MSVQISFGRRPTENFERYLNRHCSSWTFNRRQLQSVISKFCGHYCIYYCMLRSRGIDMPKIVNSFTTDTGLNDVLVHGFVCRHREWLWWIDKNNRSINTRSFISYIHDTNKRQIYVNYYTVESIIRIKFNCHNGEKCQSMLHRSQRTDSSWRRTGGILCNLANRTGSCDRHRNSKVEQSRET